MFFLLMSYGFPKGLLRKDEEFALYRGEHSNQPV